MPSFLNTAGPALALSLALAAASFSPAARATTDGWTHRVDARQVRQQGRIDAGVASGAITLREQHRLQREQRDIARTERRAEADGQVSGHERQRLERLQDRASRHISRQTRDGQTGWR